MTSSFFYEVFQGVRQQIEGFRALALVRLDGTVSEQVIADASLDPESLSEFATLLRIAQHTSEDTQAGPLLETSWTAERSLVLARRVCAESFLILVGAPELRAGYARYILRKAAWQLRPQLEEASR